MRYSDHARERLRDRHFTEADVAAVVENPVRGVFLPTTRDRKEHFGFAADGRPLNVITDRAVTIVITIVEQ